MRLGYNTNGLANHRLVDAIDLLADTGYSSVALTVDHHALNPFDDLTEVSAVKKRLERHGMSSVIETGARYLLNPGQKHEPTLISGDSRLRIDFLCRAIDLAAELESDCVSLWSGVVRDGAPEDIVWDRLLSGLRRVMDYAKKRGVVLGFEPEPGMFIDTMSRFQELLDRLGASHLKLTLDVGHLHCLSETPIADYIHDWRFSLVNVHIEDMRAGVHEHLPFGEGEIDFPPVLQALNDIGYAGGLHVELSRHSHEGPRVARAAYQFLRGLLGPLASP